ncbi:MAG: hypothetical protein AB1640_19635 [bacterium]
MEQKTGTAATLALAAAVSSYLVTFSGHPGWGLLASLVAVPLGAFGFAMAASPRVSGGVLSIVSIVLGIGAFGISVLGMIGAIVL